jgi:O-antigen ligase
MQANVFGRTQGAVMRQQAVAVVAAAVATGTSVALFPSHVSLIVLAVVSVVLVAVVTRATLRPAAGSGTQTLDGEGGGLRGPRLLYYAGSAAIGLLTIRPALSFTLSDWIFLLAFGVVSVDVLTARLRSDYLLPRTTTIGIALFAVGGLASSLGATLPQQSVSVVVRLLYLTLIWFWLGTIVLRNRTHVELAVLAWVSSAALSSAGAVVQYFAGNVIPGGTVAYGRMTGFTPQFNSLGGLAATAFVPALVLAVDSDSRVRRLLGGASLVLIGAGLLLSGSVGGLVATSLATVLWLSIRGVTPRAALILGGVGAAALVLMSATGSTNAPSPFQRVVDVTTARLPSDEQGSVHSRIEVYRRAWSEIQEQPFVGIGLDEASSDRAIGDLRVHNILLNPWLTAGILGLVGIATLAVGILATGRAVIRHSTARDRPLDAALLCSFVAFIVFAMGEPIVYVRYGWMPAAMLLALRAQRLRATASAQQRSSASRRFRDLVPTAN